MDESMAPVGPTPAPAPASPPAVQIGSILIDNVTQDEADAIIGGWLEERPAGPRRVCTPNVDYVIRAGRDPAFRGAINGCDLRVPDGMWIVYASRIAGRSLRGTVTGRLLLPRFAARCSEAGRPIAMMGAGPGVAALAAERLRADNPGLLVTAATPPTPFVIGSEADAGMVQTLQAARPAILFVALGAPKQELWMDRHAGEFPDSIMIGVGAAFDVVAGRVREAPAWMTRTGLEWLFRLAQEPRRLARRYLWDDPRILGWAVATRARGLGSRAGPEVRASSPAPARRAGWRSDRRSDPESSPTSIAGTRAYGQLPSRPPADSVNTAVAKKARRAMPRVRPARCIPAAFPESAQTMARPTSHRLQSSAPGSPICRRMTPTELSAAV